ncbi:MAG: pirin family protein [Gammaproteobacteria bacterium]
MTHRSIVHRIPAAAVSEGAGVTVRRTIGTPALRHLDPFLMLDHFGSENPDEYIAGFPDHPHRGFITFTYMLNGHMQHKDSMGNQGDLRAGGAQWMKAASGVIHSEMPQQTEGLMRGFQLWINLPATEKMSDPAYQEYQADAFPVVETAQGRIKVLIGHYDGTDAPIQDPNTHVQYYDVNLHAGGTFTAPLDRDFTTFTYLYAGDARVGDTPLPEHNLAVLDNGDHVELTAGEHGASFILVAGRPLGESIAQYGPFVMNTREEIEQAFDDYRQGRLVRTRAAMNPA